MGVKHIRADQISTEDGLVISGNVNLINGTFFTDGARFTGDWVKDENENVSREGKVGVSKDTVDNSENSANLQVSGDIDFTGDLYQNGVLFTAIIGSSPWSNLVGESNIYFTAGDVSIGINNGNAKLHVEGNVYASSNLEVGSANLFVDTETSRIGVNTRSPAATLDVEGNVYVSSDLTVSGTVEASSFIGIQDVNVPNLDASIITSGIFDKARTGLTSVTIQTSNSTYQYDDTGLRIPNGGFGFVIVQKKRSSNTGPPYYTGNPVYSRDASNLSLYVASGGTSTGTATDGSFGTFMHTIHNENQEMPTMYMSQVNSSESRISCRANNRSRGCTVVISYCPLIIP